LALIPPYDHPHVIAGQGTAALELLEETGALLGEGFAEGGAVLGVAVVGDDLRAVAGGGLALGARGVLG
ncbi:hypothetical protein B5181_41355, partial [Streptomyces sp. 4F]